MIPKNIKKSIDLKTYKSFSYIEFFPWDEKFISILFTYERNYIYNPLNYAP